MPGLSRDHTWSALMGVDKNHASLGVETSQKARTQYVRWTRIPQSDEGHRGISAIRRQYQQGWARN